MQSREEAAMGRKPNYDALEQRVKTLEIEIAERDQQKEFLLKANRQLKREIEEHALKEQSLRESQRLLRILLDTVEGEAFIKDANGKYLFVNKAYGDDFGVDPKDVIGKDDYFVFSPETAAELQKNDKRIMAARKAEKIEESGMFKGRYLTYLTNKVPIIDEEGNVLGICGVGFDITRQKETEEELRVSEKRYQNLVKNSYDIVYSVTPDGTITFVGPQISRFGHEPEEIISENYIQFVAPEQRQRVANSFEKGTKEGTSFPTEFQWLGKDGKRHWVEAVGNILYDDSGNSSLQIGVLRDIAERKQAEEALKEAHDDLERRVEERTGQLSQTVEKLREAELRYRTVADFTYDWEYWANLDGTLEYVSPSCERISGYTPRQFTENPSLYLEIVIPEDQDAWGKHYRDSRKEPKAREMQFRIRCRDGSICWIEHACQPLFDDQGTMVGFRASNRDITERKEAEIKLQKAYSEIEQLKNQLEAESAYLQQEIRFDHNFENIIGQSDTLRYVLYKVEQVAVTDATVLILGETGTGKEMIARAIHNTSPRKNRPLIKVNCAALPANLIESEFFGHEKGAFTGAQKQQIGRFELANGTTLFLDEIGELPPELQTKLLRVLEHGEFERLGSTKTLKTDVRIIAATNRDLEADVGVGRFRRDLWFRLNVFPITVPPLRRRIEDIPLLIEWFVDHYSRKYGKNIKDISKKTVQALQEYSWPGNVRELENIIERGVIGEVGGKLQLAAAIKGKTQPNQSKDHDETLDEVEHKYILKILEKTRWRVEGPKGAARILGLNPSTLRSRMNKLGIRKSGRGGD
jgi:PAS domain S-box-containing protein